MGQGVEITALAAWILLGVPYVALAAAIVLALRRRAGKAIENRTIEPSGRYGAPLGAPQQAAPPKAGPAAMKKTDAQDVAGGPGGLVTASARAEIEGDEGTSAELYLTSARAHLAAGRAKEAGDQLRKSIRTASKMGNKKVHAEARLELAEMARAEGDLTTACEHWQIARGLFFDLKHGQELEKAEKLMRQHGCPTDWVLNDF